MFKCVDVDTLSCDADRQNHLTPLHVVRVASLLCADDDGKV